MGPLHYFLYFFCLVTQFHNDFAEIVNHLKSISETHTKPWHSYIFNSGNGNREGLLIMNISLNESIMSTEGIRKWDSIQSNNNISVVGLGINFIQCAIFDKDFEPTIYKTGIVEYPLDFTLFQNWNATSLDIESFVVIAVNKQDGTFLQWHRIDKNGLVYLWDWPVHRNVSHLKIIQVNGELKLLITTHSALNGKNPSADIYSFLMNGNLDMWLFDRIPLEEIPSSVAVSNDHDYVFVSFVLPNSGIIQIYKHGAYFAGLNRFSFHQEIPSDGCSSLISFRVNFHLYLAVASSSSEIYLFKGNSLLTPVTKLELGSRRNWLAVPVNTYRGDVILLAEGDDETSVITGVGNEGIKIIGNLSNLTCYNDSECRMKTKGISLKGATSFFNGVPVVVFSSVADNSSLSAEFSVELEKHRDFVEQERREISDEKTFLEEKWKIQSAKENRLLETINSLLNKDIEDKEPLENWKIGKLIAKNAKIVPTDETEIKNVEFGRNKNWTSEDAKIDIETLKSDASSVTDEIADLKAKIAEKERKSPETALPASVFSGVIADGLVYVDELESTEINNHDVAELLRDSFRLDRIEKISGSKTFADLSVETVNFERLGNLRDSDIFFSDDPFDKTDGNVIAGDVILESDFIVLGNVSLFPGGFVNGLDFPGDVFRTNMKYNNSLTFEHLAVVEEANVFKSMNGRPMILPVHSSPLDIHSLDNVNQARVEHINVENNLNVSFINGRNVTELFQRLIFRNREYDKADDFVLRADTVRFTSELNVSYLNEQKFPEDFVLSATSEPVVITGKKFFTGSVETNDVDVGDNEFDRRSNEKEMEEFDERIYTLQNLEIDGSLIVDSINNHTWDYFSNILKKDEEKAQITGVKHFQRNVTSNHLNTTGLINNISVDDILTYDTEQVLTNPQSFNNVRFKNVNISGSWDGVCVTCLNDTIIRLTENGVFESSLIFTGENLTVKELNVTESLNDDITPEVLTALKDGVILNDDVIFEHLKSARVVVNGSLNSFDKINNVNLTDFDNVRMSSSRSQEIDRDIFLPNITIRGNVSLFRMNGYDCLRPEKEDILDGIADLIEDQRIRLRSLLVRGNVKVLDKINQINITDVFGKAVNIRKQSVVPGEVVFENSVYFNELNVTGRIDGFRLRDLKKDIVTKGNVVFIKGSKNFINGVNVTKDVNARTLNGHLVQDVTTLQGDHTMKKTVRINGDVIVKGNILLNGALSGSVVHDIYRKFSPDDNSYVHIGDLTLKDAKSVEELMVDGKINGQVLEAFVSNVVRKSDDFDIIGRKVFKNEVIFGENLTIEDTINRLDFSSFIEDVVLVNEPATINGGVVLKKGIMKKLTVENDFNSTLINGKNTDEWIEECIPLDEDVYVTGNKTFEKIQSDKRILVDFINGHSPDFMITLKGDQFVSTPLFFLKIRTASDFPVDGTVNDKNLKDEWLNTVMVNGNQTINGKTTFTENLIVHGDVIINTINGSSVENLITLHTNQTIKSVISFDGSVTVNNNIKKLKTINGIDINRWNERSVSLNQAQSINGVWTLLNNVTMMKNVDGSGLIDSVSVPALSTNAAKKKAIAEEIQGEIEADYKNQCLKIKEASFVLKRQPYLFKQFELTQVIDLHRLEKEIEIQFESIITFNANDNNYLIITFKNDCFADLYRWNKENSSYEHLKQMSIGPVRKSLVLDHNNITYIVTSSSEGDVLCGDLKPGNVWTFEGDEDKYGHMSATEGFVDIIQANDAFGKYYTLGNEGSVYEWVLESRLNLHRKFLMNVGKGDYRFVDFKIFGEVAVTNGHEIKRLSNPETLINNKIPGLHDGNYSTTYFDGKTLTAVARKDKLVVYDDVSRGKTVTSMHFTKPGSLVWLGYGEKRELFLIFEWQSKTIEVLEYKGAFGFTRKMTLNVPSLQLQQVDLPSDENDEFQKYLIVAQRKKILLLEAEMLGHLYKESDISC